MANEDHKSASYWREDEEKIEYLRRWYGAKSFAELVHMITEEKTQEVITGKAQRPLPPITLTKTPSKGMGKAGELRPKKSSNAPARISTPYSGVISLDVAEDGELAAALGGARHYYGVDEEEVSQ